MTTALLLAALLVCTAVSAAVAGEASDEPASAPTKFLTAIPIPGNPLRSFDISWADSERGLYFLADRSNSGVDIISTATNTFIGRAGGFVGILPPAALSDPFNVAVDNNHSGPDGVVSHGKCLYVGDGNSTLKVFDISDPANPKPVGQPIPTGGSTRLDEMALTADGKMLLVVNNAEDPPFMTLFTVDADEGCGVIGSGVQITVDASVIPHGHGLSIEQPAWDESTQRFIVSVPTIAENPAGCDYVLQNAGTNPCSGAILVLDPTNIENPITDDYVPLIHCGPNGATVGPRGNVMVGCTPNNQKGDNETTIINAKTFKYVDVGNLTGSDEVWYNSGSNRYYTGSSANPKSNGGAVLGVVDGRTNFLLETIPQSSASHSVAADSERNEIYVPQVAPKAVVGKGGDITPVGDGICGGTHRGCIAVYVAPHPKDE